MILSTAIYKDSKGITSTKVNVYQKYAPKIILGFQFKCEILMPCTNSVYEFDLSSLSFMFVSIVEGEVRNDVYFFQFNSVIPHAFQFKVICVNLEV